MMEFGKDPFTEANIRFISYVFRVNETWLRDGIGNMTNDKTLLSESRTRNS